MLVKSLFFLIITILSTSIYSQSFEGEIEFKIQHIFKDSTLKNNPQLPTKMTYSISGEFSKCVQKTRIGQQSIIKDTISNLSTLLINLYDEPIALQLSNKKDTNEIDQISISREWKRNIRI